MQGAIVILAVLAAVGLLLFYFDRRKPHSHHTPASGTPRKTDTGTGQTENDTCCGLHAICEKKYAGPDVNAPVYYDDEELDALSGRDPSTYTETEREQLRDVVLTLLPADAWGWSRSLEKRGIALPDDIRDELMILLAANE